MSVFTASRFGKLVSRVLLLVLAVAVLAPSAPASAVPQPLAPPQVEFSPEPAKPLLSLRALEHAHDLTAGASAALSPRAASRLKALRFVTRSARVLDLRGVESSAYKGKFFRSSQEGKRKCVFQRESNANYTSTRRSPSPTGGYFGGYQMSRGLAVGATWMMLPEHKRLLGTKAAKKVLAHLRSVPAHKWNRYWQDAAFYTVYNWQGSASGAKHWYLAGSRCG